MNDQHLPKAKGAIGDRTAPVPRDRFRIDSRRRWMVNEYTPDAGDGHPGSTFRDPTDEEWAERAAEQSVPPLDVRRIAEALHNGGEHAIGLAFDCTMQDGSRYCDRKAQWIVDADARLVPQPSSEPGRGGRSEPAWPRYIDGGDGNGILIDDIPLTDEQKAEGERRLHEAGPFAGPITAEHERAAASGVTTTEWEDHVRERGPAAHPAGSGDTELRAVVQRFVDLNTLSVKEMRDKYPDFGGAFAGEYDIIMEQACAALAALPSAARPADSKEQPE